MNNPHFNLLAPYYNHLIGAADADRLRDVLVLAPDQSLLEVGGGAARVASQLVPHAAAVWVCDVAVGMLRQIDAADGVVAVVAPAERLPFATGSIDRLLAVDALHHFANQRAAIFEMARVLAPGGRLVIEEPDLNMFGVKLIAVAEKLLLMRSHFLTPMQIAALMADAGLSVSQQHDEAATAWVCGDKVSG